MKQIFPADLQLTIKLNSSVVHIFKERVIERKEIVTVTEIYQEFLKELALKRDENSGYPLQN